MRKILVLALVAAVVFASGCTFGNPLVGDWETSVLGLKTELSFYGDGTGVIKSKLGTVSFDYEIIDGETMQVTGDMFGTTATEKIEYELVNNNTLKYKNLTFTRKK